MDSRSDKLLKNNLLDSFKSHIEQKLPFLLDAKCLITVSGGVDSMVLASLIHSMDIQTHWAHCNFRLRGGQSDTDVFFVKLMAERYDTDMDVKVFNTKRYAYQQGLSIQLAARDLRYGWFKKLAEEKECEYILTAHHLDDALETFLINLSRGTGLDGLKGIPEINENIVRPLLPFSKGEIVQYAQDKGIEWAEDSSNAQKDYLRNKLRHDVIPKLKEITPQFLSHFRSTLKYLEGTARLVKRHIFEYRSALFNSDHGVIAVPVAFLKRMEPQQTYLYELFNEYGFKEWGDILDLLDAQSGKQLFSRTHRLLKDRDFLYLQSLEDKAENKEIPVRSGIIFLDKRKKLEMKPVKAIKEERDDTIYLDKEKLNSPLVLRKWKEGDYFYPLGMTGKKKIGKYFKDEKYSLIDKENQWLLSCGDDIVWVVGKRMDRRFVVDEGTKDVLRISLI